MKGLYEGRAVTTWSKIRDPAKIFPGKSYLDVGIGTHIIENKSEEKVGNYEHQI